MTPTTHKPIAWEFWPTVISIPLLILVIVLGVWQLERLEWKQGILEKIERNLQDAPSPLPANLEDPAALEYSFVRVSGTYMHDKESQLGARYYDGALGYQLLTPMKLADGRVVLVNRGWVPKGQMEQSLRPETLQEGVEEVDAIIRIPNRRNMFTPENSPADDRWFWVELSALEQKTGLDFEDVVLERVGKRGGGLPIPGTKKVDIRNDHFMYALTWFGLAIVVVAIYFMYHVNKRNEESENK